MNRVSLFVLSWSCVVYYWSMKWEVNRRLIYECRCDERLKGKTEWSTHLGYTGWSGGLEHLKIETRLIDERFASVMGECGMTLALVWPSRWSALEGWEFFFPLFFSIRGAKGSGGQGRGGGGHIAKIFEFDQVTTLGGRPHLTVRSGSFSQWALRWVRHVR